MFQMHRTAHDGLIKTLCMPHGLIKKTHPVPHAKFRKKNITIVIHIPFFTTFFTERFNQAK